MFGSTDECLNKFYCNCVKRYIYNYVTLLYALFKLYEVIYQLHYITYRWQRVKTSNNDILRK